MVDFGGGAGGLIAGQRLALDQCAAASGAPVGDGVLCEHRPAMTANTFHMQEITGSRRDSSCELVSGRANSFRGAISIRPVKWIYAPSGSPGGD